MYLHSKTAHLHQGYQDHISQLPYHHRSIERSHLQLHNVLSPARCLSWQGMRIVQEGPKYGPGPTHSLAS